MKEKFEDYKNKLLELLHIKRPEVNYADYITNYGWIEKVTDEINSLSLGTDACRQMLELNITLRSLKKEIKETLPDYLKDNLVEIETSGTIDNIRLNFYFNNYNKMNKSLLNEIRQDFKECIQTEKLPNYKVLHNNEFMLVVAIKDYSELILAQKE